MPTEMVTYGKISTLMLSCGEIFEKVKFPWKNGNFQGPSLDWHGNGSIGLNAVGSGLSDLPDGVTFHPKTMIIFSNVLV